MKSAPLHSQLAGVLAGVAVLGLTLILTRQVLDSDSDEDGLARLTISEFFLAFLALAIAALEWGIVAGEEQQASVRAGSAAVFATITLALGGLQMVAGLCYLVTDYDARIRGSVRRTLDTSRTCLTGYIFVATLAVFHTALTASDVITRGFGGNEFPDASWVWYVVPVLAALLVAVAMTRPIATFGARSVASFRTTKIGSSRWFSYRRLVGALAVYGVIAFSLTINTDGSSPFVRAGGWEAGLGVTTYLVALLIGLVTCATVFIVQAWLIRERLERVEDDVPPPLAVVLEDDSERPVA